jgi:hypothetical protein
MTPTQTISSELIKLCSQVETELRKGGYAGVSIILYGNQSQISFETPGSAEAFMERGARMGIERTLAAIVAGDVTSLDPAEIVKGAE